MGNPNSSYSTAESLAKVNKGVIARLGHPLSIGELECALLKEYPREDAEEWDRMGLIVGDPLMLVSRVLVALDPTLDVIDTAIQAKATLVLTHHPVFLEPPVDFKPLSASSDLAGTIISRAMSQGISLMNIHTALDCAPETQKLLPSLLSLDPVSTLKPLQGRPGKGYGALCTSPSGESFRLDHLAARCLSVFGALPRVWGSPSSIVSSIAVVNGSGGFAVEECLKRHADCLICGELHYHQALNACQKGLAIIELGHDVSELPLSALLAQAAIRAGIQPKDILIFEQSPHWFTPDATRA